MREWAAEVIVDEALARRLIGAQFPELELGSLRLLGQGWDMTAWLVDEEWVFRFPRRQVVIRGLLNEISELPKLVSLLPLPIPSPTYLVRSVSRLPLAVLRRALPSWARTCRGWPGRQGAYRARPTTRRVPSNTS